MTEQREPEELFDAPPPRSEGDYGEFDAVEEFITPVKRVPAQMSGKDDAAPLGDPFHKLPAPPLPRDLLPPILEAFAEREARIKGVEFAAPAMAALTVCAAAIPDHVILLKRHLIRSLAIRAFCESLYSSLSSFSSISRICSN